MYYIYALVDPINNVPFYIGKGKNNRVYQHLNGNDKGNEKKVKIIESIRLLGHEPKITYIAENIDDEKYAYDLEYAIIKLAYLYFGKHITNRVGVDMRPPSRKGSKLSFLSRDKISEALRKRIRKPMSMEQKEKISKKLKDKPKKERSVEHRKNIGLSKAKSYIIIFPDGKQEEIFNMTDFCRKYNLSQPHLHSTSKGKRKHHKGFSAILKSQEI